ncbi:MAG TPA: hypothetical protein VK814_12390 [Acidobacteriaceae bacterium]|nr:hypothetical protein [Acidobacteriaceae bacterium]
MIERYSTTLIGETQMLLTSNVDADTQRLFVRLVWIFGIGFGGFVMVVFGTITKNRFGANLEAVRCPQCNTLQPQIRKAATWQQALWGGWTCKVCKTQMDKWGRRVGS